jgi:23S rRNA pseudouridine1911/1915/1917 synthase
VVEKPAGQACAPLGPGETGSLAGALVTRYPEMQGVGYRAREPGLIHRLDTGTSGLVIAARNAEAFAALVEALQAHRLDKRYLAIVEAAGLPDSRVIELPLMPGSGGKVVVAPLDGRGSGVKDCTSSFRTLERRGRFALVEVEASRAYRHQVRVHLAASGWPIAGDVEYGGAARPALAGRHALHASHVAWAGDARVPAFAVDSPLPDDLLAFFREGSALAGSAGDSINDESS